MRDPGLIDDPVGVEEVEKIGGGQDSARCEVVRKRGAIDGKLVAGF